MPRVYEQYTEELHREFGYLAAWLPNSKIELGDVGTLHRDRFERLTSLRDLGVAFTTSTSPSLRELDYASAGQVDVRFGGLAVADPPHPGRSDAMIAEGMGLNADTTRDSDLDPRPTAAVATSPALGSMVTVQFHRAYSVFLEAVDVEIRAVADHAALEAALRRLVQNDSWRREYCVITEVVLTGSAVILVSSQAGGRVDFSASAHVQGGPLALARAAAGLKLLSTSGVAVKLVAPEGLTPLFRASRLRRRRGGGPRLVYRDADSPSMAQTADISDSAVLVDCSYDDAQEG